LPNNGVTEGRHNKVISYASFYSFSKFGKYIKNVFNIENPVVKPAPRSDALPIHNR
jgi:hypothetical protein